MSARSSLQRSLRALEKKHGMHVYVLAMFLSVEPCRCAIYKRIGSRGKCIPCQCRDFRDEYDALLGIGPKSEKTG